MILLAPICLSHEDIKDEKVEEDLLFQSRDELGWQETSGLTVKGVPIESEEFVPCMLLVPH